MTAQHRCLPHRDVVEVVLVADRVMLEGLVPALLDEMPGQVAVPDVPGGAIQLHQPDLDLRVTVRTSESVRAEVLADPVSEADRGARQVVLDARPQPGDGGLEQVPGAVELVPVRQVGVPLIGSTRPEERVEVPIVLLRGSNQGRQLRQTPLTHRVRPQRGLPGERLQQLVHVGIGKELALQRFVRRLAGRPPESVVPAHRLDPRVAVVQQLGRVQLLSDVPETAADTHRTRGDGGKRACGRHHRAQAHERRPACLRKASPSTASAS